MAGTTAPFEAASGRRLKSAKIAFYRGFCPRIENIIVHGGTHLTGAINWRLGDLHVIGGAIKTGNARYSCPPIVQ